MSNRQERILRKAYRRKQKLLDAVRAIEAPVGMEFSATLPDYRYRFAVAIQDQLTGYRMGCIGHIGKKAKGCEAMPALMADKLIRMAMEQRTAGFAL